MLAELLWIRLGIGAGITTCAIYPALLFIPLPRVATVTLAAVVGPLLGVASLGLSRLLRIPGRNVFADLGAALNILAGGLFSAMLLVQLAVRLRAQGAVDGSLVGTWLGLDVAWDAYIALGTACFGIGMWKHPRFGRVFGATGVAVAAILLLLNVWTFPEPPAEAGLFDLGPVVGLWYLLVTLQAWRSLAWARTQLAGID